MLTVKGCSEAELFREWFNQGLRVYNFENTLAMTIIFLFKMFNTC